MARSQHWSLHAPLVIFEATAVLSATATLLIIFWARAHRLPYPYNWPFLRPGGSFADFYEFFRHQSTFRTRGGTAPFTYLAPGVWLYRSFYIFGSRGSLCVYFIEITAAFVLSIKGLHAAMIRRGESENRVNAFLFVLIIFASYPVLFCLERCNLEIIIAIGIGLGSWQFMRGRYWIAAILWGIFGSIKLYPLLLLGLFFSRSRFRFLLTGFVTSIATILASFYLASPTLRAALGSPFRGPQTFLDRYGLGRLEEMGFDHSLFGFMKRTIPHATISPSMLNAYFIVCGLGALIVFLLRVRRMPVANQFVFLAGLSILLPPTSFDYTLMHMYVPFTILVLVALEAARSRVALRGLTAAFILFALVFTPTNFLFIHGIGYAGQIKCAVLLALVAAATFTPWSANATANSTSSTEAMARTA